MNTRSPGGTSHKDVMDLVEKEHRVYWYWVGAAAFIEAACLIAFVLLADFGNRLHLLLLITACLVYGTLAMGILALGAFTQSWCRRIIKSIELLDEARE